MKETPGNYEQNHLIQPPTESYTLFVRTVDRELAMQLPQSLYKAYGIFLAMLP